MPSKTLSVIVSEETHSRLEKLAKLRLWSVSQSARVLIEQGLDREGIEAENVGGDELPGSESVNNTSSDSQPQQSVSEDVPQRRAKRMSGKEFMQQKRHE